MDAEKESTNLRTDSITTILLDWDGTLMESAQMGLVAFTKMFAEMGLHFDHQLYEEFYSPNWYSMYTNLGLPRERWQEADNLWLLHYGEEAPALVEGALGTLVELSRRGYNLGVVSSGSESRVKREIRQLQLAPLFQTVICSEDTVHKKPHPEGLQRAMDALGQLPRTCAYVGDSPEDIEMGRQAQLLTVGVRSAYPGSKRLLSARPDIYLESIVELLDHF
jgi:HAD superfamily hydrolase (TIGR01509 family)